MSPIAGQFVTETFAYDGGRQVTAYVPEVAPEAIVFAGDGQLLVPWGRDLAAADLPPTMIVGAHRVVDESLRIREYSAGESTSAFRFDSGRFAAHEEFFVDVLPRWAHARFDVELPAERTAVLGVSASGELALAMGLRHPDVYGAVLCASPGAGYRPPAVMPSSLPRVYLVAGAREPFYSSEREEVGSGAARRRRGGGHDRKGRVAWRRVLARGVPTDGGVGVRRLSFTPVGPQMPPT